MKIYFHLNINGFSNCYIVVNEIKKEAIIIDPCQITEEVINRIECDSYKLVAALITHNHTSHVHGLKTLQKIYTPVIYAADNEIATHVLKGDGSLHIAGLDVLYAATPGHTDDSVIYKIGTVLFTGDTISAGKIGPTPSTKARNLMRENIAQKIFSQTDDTVIMPGHGPPTSVGAEKLFNIGMSE